jgi:hypothetical protein
VSYEHAEAFCHMRYRSDDHTEGLVVWNSRDGVTPFVITLPSGKQATHIDWHTDRRDPAHVPVVGEWVFVDLIQERANLLADRQAARLWADPDLRRQIQQQYGTAWDLAASLAADAMRQPGRPDLVQVDEELRARLLAGRAELVEQPGAEALPTGGGEAHSAPGPTAGAAVPEHATGGAAPDSSSGVPPAAPSHRSELGASSPPVPGSDLKQQAITATAVRLADEGFFRRHWERREVARVVIEAAWPLVTAEIERVGAITRDLGQPAITEGSRLADELRRAKAARDAFLEAFATAPAKGMPGEDWDAWWQRDVRPAIKRHDGAARGGEGR